MKPRSNYAPYPKDYDSLKHRQRKPDKDILDHDRLREIEVKVFDLRDKLEDEECVAKSTNSDPLLILIAIELTKKRLKHRLRLCGRS